MSTDVDVVNNSQVDPKWSLYSPYNSPSFHLSVVLCQKVKVISRDGGASLPIKEGRAEILNSSLVNYSSVTVCARFLTHHFSTDPEGWQIQSLISYGWNILLGSYVAMPCEQSYTGCTQEYQDIFSENQLAWISGKVFGDFLISSNHHFYPAWLPAVWNSACLSASPGQGHFRLNINGLTALEMKDFNNNLFRTDTVSEIKGF